jgi:hypothetical protein
MSNAEPVGSEEIDLRTNPQLRQIIGRLKDASQEERKRLFADLKKTPHLFAAFLKMKPAVSYFFASLKINFRNTTWRCSFLSDNFNTPHAHKHIIINGTVEYTCISHRFTASLPDRNGVNSFCIYKTCHLNPSTINSIYFRRIATKDEKDPDLTLQCCI